MIQGRDDACFTQEALHRLGIGARLVGQELDGHLAAEARVFGFVDHAHAAGAEARQDLVVRDRLADHGVPVSGSSSTSRIFFDKLHRCEGLLQERLAFVEHAGSDDRLVG